MSWFKWSTGGQITESKSPDNCPNIPDGAIVVKPLISGGYGPFRKELFIDPGIRTLHLWYDLKQLTSEAFATVKLAEARWKHSLQEPVVIHDPSKKRASVRAK